ncbi:glycosyltransferase [Oculatella sp. LEGE 06141]|nr:glycosyltransferase [Oculatella sp. LEGE 06141]
MPLVSVVIPAFNAAETIQATIASALDQTITALEVIVINDGSNDATLNVVDRIHDPRLKVLSYPNGGLAIARNRGIAQASGEFISFLDADDLWTSDKLEKQLDALQQHPQAAVAYSWTDWIDTCGQFVRHGRHLSPSGNVYADLLVSNFLENGSNLLVQKQALTNVGGFDESLPAAQDWDMGLRLAARYEFAVVRSPQILYRASPGSMSTNVVRLERACRQILDREFQRAPQAIQALKPRSLATLYLFLTFKAIDGMPSRQRSITATRYWLNAIRYDGSLLLKRTRLMAIVALKISVQILFSPPIAQHMLNRLRSS